MTRFKFIGPVALVMVVGLAVSMGSVRMSPADVVRILIGQNENAPPGWSTILRHIRLPRVLAAAMVGGALATGGVVCQGIFRNPLSEPYLLGISSGAALGAALAIVFSTASAGGLGAVGLSAFLGALGVTGIVFLAAGRGAFRVPSTLLLSGIAVAFLCQAGIWLLMTLNRNQVERILFWTLGSFASVDWFKVIWLAAVTLPAAAAMAGFGRVLDVLSTGHDSAHGLGVHPQRAVLAVLSLTALSTAAAVAVAGSIGFIGLMIPHVVRLLGGPTHRRLVIRSWFGGAILLVLADLAARTIAAPGEIPVGIITALLGAPFLSVLVRGKRGEGRLDG